MQKALLLLFVLTAAYRLPARHTSGAFRKVDLVRLANLGEAKLTKLPGVSVQVDSSPPANALIPPEPVPVKWRQSVAAAAFVLPELNLPRDVGMSLLEESSGRDARSAALNFAAAMTAEFAEYAGDCLFFTPLGKWTASPQADAPLTMDQCWDGCMDEYVFATAAQLKDVVCFCGVGVATPPPAAMAASGAASSSTCRSLTDRGMLNRSADQSLAMPSFETAVDVDATKAVLVQPSESESATAAVFATESVFECQSVCMDRETWCRVAVWFVGGENGVCLLGERLAGGEDAHSLANACAQKRCVQGLGPADGSVLVLTRSAQGSMVHVASTAVNEAQLGRQVTELAVSNTGCASKCARDSACVLVAEVKADVCLVVAAEPLAAGGQPAAATMPGTPTVYVKLSHRRSWNLLAPGETASGASTSLMHLSEPSDFNSQTFAGQCQVWLPLADASLAGIGPFLAETAENCWQLCEAYKEICMQTQFTVRTGQCELGMGIATNFIADSVDRKQCTTRKVSGRTDGLPGFVLVDSLPTGLTAPDAGDGQASASLEQCQAQCVLARDCKRGTFVDNRCWLSATPQASTKAAALYFERGRVRGWHVARASPATVTAGQSTDSLMECQQLCATAADCVAGSWQPSQDGGRAQCALVPGGTTVSSDPVSGKGSGSDSTSPATRGAVSFSKVGHGAWLSVARTGAEAADYVRSQQVQATAMNFGRCAVQRPIGVVVSRETSKWRASGGVVAGCMELCVKQYAKLCRSFEVRGERRGGPDFGRSGECSLGNESTTEECYSRQQCILSSTVSAARTTDEGEGEDSLCFSYTANTVALQGLASDDLEETQNFGIPGFVVYNNRVRRFDWEQVLQPDRVPVTQTVEDCQSLCKSTGGCSQGTWQNCAAMQADCAAFKQGRSHGDEEETSCRVCRGEGGLEFPKEWGVCKLASAGTNKDAKTVGCAPEGCVFFEGGNDKYEIIAQGKYPAGVSAADSASFRVASLADCQTKCDQMSKDGCKNGYWESVSFGYGKCTVSMRDWQELDNTGKWKLKLAGSDSPREDAIVFARI